MDEAELLLRLNGGDQHAFELIFKKFYGALCFFSTRLISDQPAAEEIVQDILLKLWIKRSDFDQFNELKAFLYISTRNACLNFLDKENRKIKRIKAANIKEAIEPGIVNELIYTEVLREISSELDRLPEQCGKIIRMIFEEDLKPREIAEKLHITVSTVYNQKMRGLSILRKRLSEQGFKALIIILLSFH